MLVENHLGCHFQLHSGCWPHREMWKIQEDARNLQGKCSGNIIRESPEDLGPVKSVAGVERSAG